MSKSLFLSFLLLSCSCAPIQPVSVQEPKGFKVAKAFFHDEINEESAGKTIEFLHQAPLNGFDVVVIEWNSPGGEVLSGFELAKAIEDSIIPVVCVVDGQADSMAFYILQSCHVRLMTRRSMLMVHKARIGGAPSIDPIVNANRKILLDALNFAMAEHITERMCITRDELLEKISVLDWWMNWEDALKVGAVDGVVRSTKDVIEWYKFSLSMPLNAQHALSCNKSTNN